MRFEDATNYSSLEETNIPREHIQRNPLQAIKFTRDTLALVEKTAPRPEFKKELDEFERQVLALIEASRAGRFGRVSGTRAAVRNARERLVAVGKSDSARAACCRRRWLGDDQRRTVEE